MSLQAIIVLHTMYNIHTYNKTKGILTTHTSSTQNICLNRPLYSRRKYYCYHQIYEIIMVPSNHSFFQYCDSDIGLFSIAPCILFGISSLLFFLSYLFQNCCLSFSLLKAIAIRLLLLFANSFKNVKERQLLLSQ